MPTLDEHQSAEFIKLLIMGDSGTGKTGSIASLVGAGYKLAILDFDNGLDVVAKAVKKNWPDKMKNVHFQTLRDSKVATDAGAKTQGIPKAYVNAIKLLDKWEPAKYGLTGEPLGKTADLGSEWIVVLDSLTFFSDMAFMWYEAMNPGVKDRRQIFYGAQQAVADLLAILTSPQFKVNVIVISHVTYLTRADGSQKGYPSSVGKAQAENIPTYFNSVALAESIGTNPPKRTIRTQPTALIDLKSPAALEGVDKMPVEIAMAEYFKHARN